MIYLYHHNDHYNVITSMSGFLSGSFFVHVVAKETITKIINATLCVMLVIKYTMKRGRRRTGLSVKKCHRYFCGQACFDLLVKRTAKDCSICLALYRCAQCGKTVNKKWIKIMYADKFIVMYANDFPLNRQMLYDAGNHRL